MAIRKLILKGVENGVDIAEVERDIQDEFGDSAIQYSELDFWFYRFHNGDKDLKHDRTLEPKFRELSDLPKELVQKIIGDIPFPSRPSYEPEFFTEQWNEIVTQEVTNMINLLQTLSLQIHTEIFQLSFGHMKELLLLLPFIKPGILKKIWSHNVIDVEENSRELFLALFNMDQWKLSQSIVFGIDEQDPLATTPIECFVHFKQIGFFAPLTHSRLIWMRELATQSNELDLLQSPTEINFRETCNILGADIEVYWEDEVDGFALWNLPEPDRTFLIRIHHGETHSILNIYKKGGATFDAFGGG